MNGNIREPDQPLQFRDEITVGEKRPKKTTCVKFCDNFGDYSENTTIHGVKYLGERERPIAEKIWWVIGFLICISFLGYFIYIIVDKWQKSPVILTTDDKTTSIYKVPFPAVTLCPETKIKSQLLNYTKTTRKLRRFSRLAQDERPTNSSITYFEAISHVCYYQHFMSTDQSLWKGKQVMDKSYVDMIQDLAPDYYGLFIRCRWGNETDCTKLLKPIITYDGQCYTFNIIAEILRKDNIQNDYKYFDDASPKKHWLFDEGYTSDAIDDAHPKRAMAMGKNHGLSLTLRSYNDDLNYLCRNGEQGYKITLHNPTEFPQPRKQFIRVPHGQNAEFAITPRTIKTANSINSYSPERRQCYFNHERHLQFFRNYNQMNCKLECVSNYTYSSCGCVKYSMPRGRNIPICGVKKIPCYAPIWNDWENDVLRKQFKEEYHGKNESSAKSVLDKCNCLPECSLVQYTNEHEFSKYNLEDEVDEFPELLKKFEDGSNRKYTITNIYIYFASTKFYGETRSELYGISDLVSNFGGLLGLFMGGSLLSLVELLYFCTIRNLCNSRRANLSTDVA